MAASIDLSTLSALLTNAAVATAAAAATERVASPTGRIASAAERAASAAERIASAVERAASAVERAASAAEQSADAAERSAAAAQPAALTTLLLRPLLLSIVSIPGSPVTKPRPFRFLDLPLEVRRMIYRCNLISHHKTIRLFNRHNHFLGAKKPINLGVNILRVCKSIREEAAEVLYSRNTFCILPRVNLEQDQYKPSQRGDDFCCCFGSEMHYVNVGAAERNLGTNIKRKEDSSYVRNLEILLPDPWNVCMDHIMGEGNWFSNLHSITYVLYEPWTPFRFHQSPQYVSLIERSEWVEYYETFASIMPKAPFTRFDLSLILESDESDAEESAEAKNILQEGFGIGEAGLELTRTELCIKKSLDQMSCGHCEKEMNFCTCDGRQAHYFMEDESDDEEKFASRDVEEEE